MMNISLNHFAGYAVSFFNDSIIPPLTSLQKKIITVAAIAFGCLLACSMICRLYINAKYNTTLSLKRLFDDPKALDKLPILESSKIRKITSPQNGPFIDPDDMTSQIMKGEDLAGRKILAFRIRITLPFSVYQEAPKEPFIASKDKHDNMIGNHVLILSQYELRMPQLWLISFPGWLDDENPFECVFTSLGLRKEDKENFHRLQELIKNKRIEHQKYVFELY